MINKSPYFDHQSFTLTKSKTKLRKPEGIPYPRTASVTTMPTPLSSESSRLSRRNFLQFGTGLGAISLLPSVSRGTATSAPAQLPPGLMFDHAELPRLRQSLQHPAFAPYWESAHNADITDDRHFLTQEVDLKNRVRDLGRVAGIALRSSFVHAIEPNAQHLAIAILAIETAMKFKTWDWILEDEKRLVGVMRGPMVGVQLTCAQDWLGSDLSPPLRDAIIQRLADEVGPAAYRAVHGELGATPIPKWSMDPDSTGLTRNDVSQWPKILAKTNLQIIATSGLIAAAAMAPEHPEAEKWQKIGLESLRNFIAHQPSDGSFDEGSAYWGFTYNYFCLCLELLRRHCGIDERNIADFPAMSRYFLRATMPTHNTPRDTLSIGDCSNSGSVIALSWIAREFRDSTAQHLLTRPGMATTEVGLCWAAIWFDPSVSTKPAADITTDYLLEPGLVVSRTGWTDQDSVVCLRSGDPCNHEHADRNSLLFTAFGERLFNDPVKASYDPQHPRWLLRETEAHTSLLIDGRGHTYHKGEEGTNASQAKAQLDSYQVGDDWMSVTSDATDAYKRAGHLVTHVARTIVFHKSGTLIVFDSVNLDSPKPIELRYQVHNDDGDGQVSTGLQSFEIRRPLARLQAQVAGTQTLDVSTGQLALPTEHGVYPFASVKSASARQHRILTICTAHPQSADSPAVTWRRNEETWSVISPLFNFRIEDRQARRSPIVSRI